MKGLIIKRSILVFSGLLGAVLLLEILMRIAGFSYTAFQEFGNRVTLKKKDSYRIMCLGESTTAGGDTSYPRQLEKILNGMYAKRKFSVINKGIGATTTGAILSMLDDNIRKYSPDMIVAMMGVNDQLLPGIVHEDSPEGKGGTFFGSLRVFRLAVLMRLHLKSRLGETGLLPAEAAGDSTGPGQAVNGRQTDLKERKTELEKNAAADPGDVEAYIQLGICYREAGEYEKGVRVLKKAIEMDPRNDRAMVELGGCYKGMLFVDEELYKKVLSINPGNTRAYTELGWYYICVKEYDRAQEMFSKVAEIDPGDYYAYYELGYIYRNQGRYDKSEKALIKALEICPDESQCVFELARCYEEQGRSEEAAACYARAGGLVGDHCGNPYTANNYRRLKEASEKKGIKLVLVQYPMRSAGPLKDILGEGSGVVYVDNERIFRDAVGKDGYDEYFEDRFAGDFGHCTPKGNRLLAGNIARVIREECLGD
ncbi:MAG: tetratricopeptide repeat protein [Elusimicrobia bacterium]|nr:tetratricopeptide repeat protein [Elusimicrobiota bacterium]